MYPILGTIPGLGVEVRTYLVARWAYFLLAALLTVRLNRRRGIGASATFGAFAVGIPAALIGGHLLNVFEAWPYYRMQPWRILDVFAGGSSIYGALGLGTFTGVIYLRYHQVSARLFLDAAAPVMALGEAMSRVGCFLNGCCFGTPTSVLAGVTYPRGSQPFIAHVTQGLIPQSAEHSLAVHPTQLYAAGICGLLSVLLLWSFARDQLFPGALLCVFAIAYGLQRLILGVWRADAVLYWREVSEPLSVLTIAVGVVLWLLWRRADEPEEGSR